jgi:hypothetical protein
MEIDLHRNNFCMKMIQAVLVSVERTHIPRSRTVQKCSSCTMVETVCTFCKDEYSHYYKKNNILSLLHFLYWTLNCCEILAVHSRLYFIAEWNLTYKHLSYPSYCFDGLSCSSSLFVLSTQ